MTDRPPPAPTPGQILGPYYPPNPDPDADFDLTRWPGAAEAAHGPTVLLSGRVRATDRGGVAGALVEVWQCDSAGRYRHPDAPETELVDPRFEGYGRVIADADGGYVLRVLRPVPYPGRTPHVHFRVTAAGLAPLVTQMYVAGEARNADDFALARAGDQRDRLVVALQPAKDGPDAWTALFDIVLSPMESAS